MAAECFAQAWRHCKGAEGKSDSGHTATPAPQLVTLVCPKQQGHQGLNPSLARAPGVSGVRYCSCAAACPLFGYRINQLPAQGVRATIVVKQCAGACMRVPARAGLDICELAHAGEQHLLADGVALHLVVVGGEGPSRVEELPPQQLPHQGGGGDGVLLLLPLYLHTPESHDTECCATVWAWSHHEMAGTTMAACETGEGVVPDVSCVLAF